MDRIVVALLIAASVAFAGYAAPVASDQRPEAARLRG